LNDDAISNQSGWSAASTVCYGFVQEGSDAANSEMMESSRLTYNSAMAAMMRLARRS
jgi:hypothetical protein